jgi:Chlorophyll A-B binding protein
MIGDVGFDPCFLSTKADSMAGYFNGLFSGNAPIDGLTWYREAELMHGRICMMAVVGFIWPGLFGTFGGNEWTGVDAYSATNPIEAMSVAPSAALFQIFAFMAGMEFRRINIIRSDGKNYMAGDSQKWGQGQGRWNPLGLNYSPAEYAEKQLQEVKHSRLAMIGLLGLIFQANASGVGVIDQLSGAFTVPEYAAKAGYFLPEGI